MQKFKSRPLIIRILVIALPLIYLALFLALYFTCGKEFYALIKDKEQFAMWISSFGIYDEIVFVAIRAVQTVVKIVPAEPLEIGAGYVWGTWKGLGLCMLGTEIGSLIILFLVSRFGTKLINLLFDTDKLKEWEFIKNSKKKYSLLTVIYLIPGTPKDFITYFVGITDTKILPFLVVTGLARIPSIISSTWCGDILDMGGVKYFIAAFGAITVISFAAAALFSKYIKKRRAVPAPDKGAASLPD
ncbi:MAG: VTT domain-containing protein [Clostridiales bacterium]|nr:VTT domain-containing protein [Clostridiales bacterium]